MEAITSSQDEKLLGAPRQPTRPAPLVCLSADTEIERVCLNKEYAMVLSNNI